VAARRKSYHGASLGALSVTGDWRNQAHATVDEWTLRIPEPAEDPDTFETRKLIEAFGPGRIAAFCLETITAANGVISAPSTWWKGIRKICDDHGILLILDEVACGFYRTGKAFAFQHDSIRPDLVCMAKAISGGYFPFGAVWLSDQLSSRYDEKVLAAGLTAYAHPVGIAAMSGVLDILEDESFLKSLQSLEKRFASHLDQLRMHPQVREIRCFGMMAGVNLITPDLQKRGKIFQKAGVYLFAKDDLMVLAPALNMKPERLDLCVQRLHFVLDQFAALKESSHA
jgi:taurine--2-oxoglutarate transaminase